MISLINCLWIALVSYLGYMSTPWLVGSVGGWYGISRPLVAGMVIGLILGDVTTGIMVGAAVQMAFLVLVTPGSSVPIDLNAMAYIGVALGIIIVRLGGTVETGIVWAVAAGGIGTVFYRFVPLKNEFWNQKATEAIEEADTKRLFFANWIGPQLAAFLWRVLPVFFCLYFGQTAVHIFINYFQSDGYVMRIFNAFGGLLPAVGIAMFLSLLVKKNFDLIIFLFGFVLVACFELNIVLLTCIALAMICFCYKLSLTDTQEQKKEAEDDELEDL